MGQIGEHKHLLSLGGFILMSIRGSFLISVKEWLWNRRFVCIAEISSNPSDLKSNENVLVGGPVI